MTGVPLTFFMGKIRLSSAKTVFDSVVPGLGVRVTPAGRQTFVLKFQLKGKAKWLRIAPAESMTLDQARKLAIRMKLLAKAGQDPSELLAGYLTHEKINQAPTICFGKFSRIYIEDHSREFKESWKKDQQRINDYFLPYWKDRSLTSITRADISTVHRHIGKKHGKVAANRALETLSKMFNLAVFWGYLPEDYPNPTKGVEKYEELERTRFLTKSEIAKIGEVLKTYPSKAAVNAIKFDLYTGLRSGELLSLRWDWIDFDECLLTIPASITKTGEPHYLPLNEAAMRLLTSIKTNTDSVFVFPGKSKGTHLSRFDKDWRKICKLAGIENAKPHDIRRTVGSWVVQSTGNVAVVGKILNHTQTSTTMIYSRFARDDVRAALECFGTRMESFLDSELSI